MVDEIQSLQLQMYVIGRNVISGMVPGKYMKCIENKPNFKLLSHIGGNSFCFKWKLSRDFKLKAKNCLYSFNLK